MAGEAARNGGQTSDARNAFFRLAQKDPLNPQPFLFFGALAERNGTSSPAADLFNSALRRDPRSVAGHYFMATHALRKGDADTALAELSNLSRLHANSVDFAQTFSAYAQATGNKAVLRRVLAREPQRRDYLLYVLAGDPRNADLVVELSDRLPPRTGEPGEDWRAHLVRTLANAGDYRGARVRWAQLSGKPLPEGLATPGFAGSENPAPFNWTYVSGDAALIEPDGGGKLGILYYGRNDAMLAEQVTTLAPGRYRLSISAAGEGFPGLLSWQVQCAAAPASVIGVLTVANGNPSTEFVVPGDCDAQKLQLKAVAGPTDDNSRWTFDALRIERVGE